MSTQKPRKAFERTRVSFETKGPSLTKQAMKAECDINNILKGYLRNGIIEHVRQVEGRYGDFVDAPGYHDAMNVISEANSMFASLPAEIRNSFENSPAQFLEFAQNPENEARMREMGLLPQEYQERAEALSAATGGASGAPPESAAEEAPTSGGGDAA